jgi:hypothetical protein
LLLLLLLLLLIAADRTHAGSSGKLYEAIYFLTPTREFI